MAEDDPQCPETKVPIQIITETKYHKVTTLSEATIIRDYPPGFTAFVRAVTEHLEARLAQEKLCLDSAESKGQSLLQFVAWTVSFSEEHPPVAVPPLEAGPPGVCRISSPWIDLVIDRKPVLLVRGIVRYSERQLLADQAVLAGARNVPPGMARPLTYKEFIQYAFEYARSEIFPSQPAAKPIEERVPPDLLWLFRRARQARVVSFDEAALSDTSRAMKKGTEDYTEVVIRVIDRCFASDGADFLYNSILDVGELVTLEQYKIVDLYD